VNVPNAAPFRDSQPRERVGFVSRAVEMCKANERVTGWRRQTFFEKLTVAHLLTGLSTRRLGLDSRTIIFKKNDGSSGSSLCA